MAATAYPPRFEFGRVFADCGRVITHAAAPLMLGILVLGIAPLTATSLPWWMGSATTPSDTFRRVYVTVTTAKGVVNLLALSAVVAFVSVLSLKVLTAMKWSEAFRPRRLIAAFSTALGLTLAVNWPTLAAPIVYAATGLVNVQGLVAWAQVVGYFVVMVSVGVALPVAAADQVAPVSAAARAFKLLARLRWRMVSLAVLYFLLIAVSTYAVQLGLWGMGAAYTSPGLAQAAVRIPTVLVGALSSVALASIFLQARRIADGPSVAELHEVYA